MAESKSPAVLIAAPAPAVIAVPVAATACVAIPATFRPKPATFWAAPLAPFISFCAPDTALAREGSSFPAIFTIRLSSFFAICLLLRCPYYLCYVLLPSREI